MKYGGQLRFGADAYVHRTTYDHRSDWYRPNEPRNRVAHVLRNQFATGGGIPSFGVKLIYRLQIE